MAIIKTPVGGQSDVGFLPKSLNFQLYRGDSLDIPLLFKDSKRQPVDLAGFTATANVIDASHNVAASGVVILNDGNRVGHVRWYVADTVGLPVGVYSYSLQLTDSQGTKKTVAAGTITISEEVNGLR